MNGINPQHSAQIVLLLAFEFSDFERGHGLVLAVDDSGRKHLGEGVCPAVGCSCGKRDFVLVENCGTSDVDDGVRPALLQGLIVNVEAEV